MRAQLGFLCEVTPAPRTSEPFDGLSAQIFFVPGEPRTGDTRRNPRDDRKENLRRVLESAIPPLSHRALSAMSITP